MLRQMLEGAGWRREVPFAKEQRLQREGNVVTQGYGREPSEGQATVLANRTRDQWLRAIESNTFIKSTTPLV